MAPAVVVGVVIAVEAAETAKIVAGGNLPVALGSSGRVLVEILRSRSFWKDVDSESPTGLSHPLYVP